ncbi:MAG TPA: shikimate dehydrogenase [Streptosporangiaceae bacterium]
MAEPARHAAVLGSPVAHSLSPVLHNAAYRALGLSGWRYQAVECDESGLAAWLGSRDASWAGASLTMPLKRAVLPLLDQAEPLVADTGSANTVVFDGGARLGYNTDVAGIVTALAEAGVTPGDATVILGAGATACSALAALRALGTGAAQAAVRDPARAGGLLEVAARLGMRVGLIAFKEAGQAGRGQLVISTIPALAADGYAAMLARRTLVPAAVLDVVYDPWPTRLAAVARQAGAVVVGGFEMLLHQASRQVELMTGSAAPVQAMRQVGAAELERRAAAGPA